MLCARALFLEIFFFSLFCSVCLMVNRWWWCCCWWNDGWFLFIQSLSLFSPFLLLTVPGTLHSLTHCFFTRVLSFPCRFRFFVSELSFDFWPEKDTLADWMLQQQQQCTRSLLLLPPKPDITFCCSLWGGGGGWSLLLLFLDLLESIGAATVWQMASSYHQCQWGECVCVCVCKSVCQ